MIKTTERVENIFKTLYYAEKEQRGTRSSFEKMMESNESRLTYLNHLFNVIKRNELNEYFCCLFNENIDFLSDFMNGSYNDEYKVPKKYFEDKDECLIAPEMNELEYLFKLIEANKQMYDRFYKDKQFTLELPNKTFNQKMTRVLEIHEHNLAHLVGLTETEIEPDPNKNILKKYFLSHIKNNEKYGEKDSEKLWNWVLSKEGKNELRRLNYITLDFISKDKSKFPNNYDSNGVIKTNSLPKFKERLKKDTGLDFPIIRFSRCISKCINNLNFLNLSNTTEVILDYNAPYGRNDEKDIFIVNASPESMYNDAEDYTRKELLVNYALRYYEDDNKELKNISKDWLDEIGIKVRDKDISSYINLIKTNKFLKDIEPNTEVAKQKINNVLNDYFDRNIHLIGFDTNFNRNNISLRRSTVNNAHCDTSISLTIVDLVSDYYKRGRAFFLDKVYNGNQSNLLRLSNPREEIEYLKYMELLEPQHVEKRENLENKLATFNKKYIEFKDELNNGKRR